MAAADLFNIEILVASSLGPHATIVISPSSGYPVATIQLGHYAEEQGEHYVCIGGIVPHYEEAEENMEQDQNNFNEDEEMIDGEEQFCHGDNGQHHDVEEQYDEHEDEYRESPEQECGLHDQVRESPKQDCGQHDQVRESPEQDCGQHNQDREIPDRQGVQHLNSMQIHFVSGNDVMPLVNYNYPLQTIPMDRLPNEIIQMIIAVTVC